MVNDPIGDMLAQIKNATMAGKRVVELPHSRMKVQVATVLVQEEYLAAVQQFGDKPKLMLRLHLKSKEESPIRDIKRVSKPGLRWYVTKDEIPQVLGGMGIAIVSTSAGIMTGREAKKRGIGGELLCTVW
ncbi:MAG: 30S ribosomal protein S8 [Patescibacteria group bacterium]